MQHLLKWVPAIGWMGVIFYLSNQTGQDMQVMFPFLPQLGWGHLVAYFILALTFWYPLQEVFLRGWQNKSLSIFLCFLYGLTDEWHQLYVEGRYPEFFDIVNDVIGATVAMFVVYIWQKRVHKKV